MLKDLNYFPLDVESNIYGLTTLEFEDKTNKVLVATLDCRIYCIYYNRFKPQTREVEFTYIPNGAQIISIGALKRGTNDFVIGITHSLSPNDGTKGSAARDIIVTENQRQTTYYFNIYASESVQPSFDLDYVAQGCQTIRLRYVPYHLYSTEYIIATPFTNGSDLSENLAITRKPFWLLSGGDSSLHAYFEDKPYQSFEEVLVEECLPELGNKQGIALWIDVANLDRTGGSSIVSTSHAGPMFERVIVLGFEDGSVRLYHSVMTKESLKFKLVKASYFDAYNTIIPCVRLFNINSINATTGASTDSNKFRRLIGELKSRRKPQSSQDKKDEHLEKSLSLLVVSSTNASLIFEDVLKNGLNVMHELPDSQRLDCATTAIVGDANADGFNELLIGTHGKEILTYQYYPSERQYKLEHISVTNYPIFSLSVLDLTGDASKDVIVLLANGILVIQSSTVKELIETCRNRLGAILSALDDR